MIDCEGEKIILTYLNSRFEGESALVLSKRCAPTFRRYYLAHSILLSLLSYACDETQRVRELLGRWVIYRSLFHRGKTILLSMWRHVSQTFPSPATLSLRMNPKLNARLLLSPRCRLLPRCQPRVWCHFFFQPPRRTTDGHLARRVNESGERHSAVVMYCQTCERRRHLSRAHTKNGTERTPIRRYSQ